MIVVSFSINFTLMLCFLLCLAQNPNEEVPSVNNNVGDYNVKIQEAMSILSRFYNKFTSQTNNQELAFRPSNILKDNLLSSSLFIEESAKPTNSKGAILLLLGTFEGLQVLLSDTIDHLDRESLSEVKSVSCNSLSNLSIENQNLLIYVGEVVQSWAISAAMALSMIHATMDHSIQNPESTEPSTEHSDVSVGILRDQETAYPSIYSTQMPPRYDENALSRYLEGILSNIAPLDVAKISNVLRCLAIEPFLVMEQNCEEQIPSLDDPSWWKQQCLLKSNKDAINVDVKPDMSAKVADLTKDRESFLSSIFSRHDTIHGNLVDMKEKFMHDSPSDNHSGKQLALPWAILIGIAVGIIISLLAFTALTLHRMVIHRRMKDIGIVDDLEALSIYRKKGSTILTEVLDEHS